MLTMRAALVLTTIFGLSTPRIHSCVAQTCTYPHIDRSVVNLPILGVPASLAFGYVASKRLPRCILTATNSFGAVYMICAVGVYV